MLKAIIISVFSFIILLTISNIIGLYDTNVSVLLLCSIVISCTEAIIDTIKTHFPIKTDDQE